MAFTIQSFFSIAKTGLICGLALYMLFYNARSVILLKFSSWVLMDQHGKKTKSYVSHLWVECNHFLFSYLGLKSLMFLQANNFKSTVEAINVEIDSFTIAHSLIAISC